MDQQQATEFIIRELGKHRGHDEIIHEICEQTGWPWKKVRHFVRRVEVQHQDQIVTRQSPLLILMGVSSIIVGLFLVSFIVYAYMSGAYSDLEARPPNPFFALVGLGMIIGGIAGIWRTVSLWRETH